MGTVFSGFFEPENSVPVGFVLYYIHINEEDKSSRHLHNIHQPELYLEKTQNSRRAAWQSRWEPQKYLSYMAEEA